MQRKRRYWCGWRRSASFNLWGNVVSLGVFDYVGIAILLILIVICVQNFVVDAKGYAKVDPVRKWDGRISFECAVLFNFLCSFFLIWKDRMDIGNARAFMSRYLLYNMSCTMTFLLKIGLLMFFKFLFGWDVIIYNLTVLYVYGIVNLVMSDRVIFR